MTVHVASGLCSYVLRRTGIGDYVLDPVTREVTFGIGEAHAWLWPSSDTQEQRDARVAALGMPWAVLPLRARP